jgi:hypothetical protein
MREKDKKIKIVILLFGSAEYGHYLWCIKSKKDKKISTITASLRICSRALVVKD